MLLGCALGLVEHLLADRAQQFVRRRRALAGWQHVGGKPRLGNARHGLAQRASALGRKAFDLGHVAQVLRELAAQQDMDEDNVGIVLRGDVRTEGHGLFRVVGTVGGDEYLLDHSGNPPFA